MKFTTTLAIASLFSAVFVAANPNSYEDEFAVVGRDFDDYEVEARYYEDLHDIVTREFEDALTLYLRSGFGKAIKKAAKDTADIGAQKIYDTASGSGQQHTNRPNFAQSHGHGGGARPVGHHSSSSSHSHRK